MTTTKKGASAADSGHHEAVGRAIQVARTAQGLSRTQLAERTGLSYPYVSEIETGKKRGSSRSLLAIAGALEMRLHDLLEMAVNLETEAPAALRHEGQEGKARTSGSPWFRSPGLFLADSSAPPPAQSLGMMKRGSHDDAGQVRRAIHELVEQLSREDLELAMRLLERLTSR